MASTVINLFIIVLYDFVHFVHFMLLFLSYFFPQLFVAIFYNKTFVYKFIRFFKNVTKMYCMSVIKKSLKTIIKHKNEEERKKERKKKKKKNKIKTHKVWELFQQFIELIDVMKYVLSQFNLKCSFEQRNSLRGQKKTLYDYFWDLFWHTFLS